MRSFLRFAGEGLGRASLVFALLAAAYLVLMLWAPQARVTLVLLVAVGAAGMWLGGRIVLAVVRAAVWRLRNRLLVTYGFIAVLPIALIVALAGLSSYSLLSQLAVYLVSTELDRRIEALEDAGRSIVGLTPERMAELAPRLAESLGRGSDAGLEILGRARTARFRYPAATSLNDPPEGWQSTRGVLIRDGRPYLWSYLKSASSSLTVTLPLTRELLESLIPGLGLVDFGAAAGGSAVRAESDGSAARALPLQEFPLDREVLWFATVPTAEWDRPGRYSNEYVLAVRTRVSAVLGAVFNRGGDPAQSVLTTLLLAGLVVFVVVEIVSLILGGAMTRTITGAVHRLYEGTVKVTEGDFSHRIAVAGSDQLAELGHSFNRMTANVEHLLTVSKEKERMQSEIEIARDVQRQLFPRRPPESAALRITGSCQPARMVSGDYYDYAVLGDGRIVLAIGDVAGKGISAALLMAALHSSLRAQLQVAQETGAELSPAVLLDRLNRQLYAATAPEKFATLWLGLYHPSCGELSYSNAGHLPPALIRGGAVTWLDVNGTVAGAFPASKYAQSTVKLQPGDLLVAFTDGVTEAENSYGEMLGEQRLVDLLARQSGLGDQELIESLAAGVREWTGATELQDDLTVLLVRRVE